MRNAMLFKMNMLKEYAEYLTELTTFEKEVCYHCPRVICEDTKDLERCYGNYVEKRIE